MKATLFRTSVSTHTISLKIDQNSHLHEIKRNGNIPLRPRLIRPLVERRLTSRADIDLLPRVIRDIVHRIASRMVRFGASAFGSEHQHGGGDPQ